MIAGARQAVSFLTPLGGPATPSPAALAWFPLVGAAMGGALGAVWWGMARAWPAPVGAAVVVALDLALTGMLHFDGLVDSADGLLPQLPSRRRLEVMHEPTAGAFGLAAGGATLLLRFAALSAVGASVLLLVALWAASRTVMVLVVWVVPYARNEGGLASAFGAGGGPGNAPGEGSGANPPGEGSGANAPGEGSAGEPGARPTGWGRPGRVALVLGAAGAVGCAVAWRPVAGPVALSAGALAATGVVWLAVRRIGGFTGDVLGAAGVVLETVGLLVAAARW